MTQTPDERRARTVATEQLTVATIEYAKTHEGDWTKTWLSGEDTCSGCKTMNGSEIGATETWSGLSGPPFHDNCTCGLELNQRQGGFATRMAQQIQAEEVVSRARRL